LVSSVNIVTSSSRLCAPASKNTILDCSAAARVYKEEVLFARQ
jgi:hypothetical protein